MAKHKQLLSGIEDFTEKWDRLCELNVVEQVLNVCQTTVVQEAWERGQDITVHGWVYGLNDGLVHDLGFSVSNQRELVGAYRNAVSETRRNVVWES